MSLELMIALIIILPVIVFFAIFVWYLNLGRIFAAVKGTPHGKPAVSGRKNPV